MIREFLINLDFNVQLFESNIIPWSEKTSIILFHLPVMNGWHNACDTVIRFSGSNTKTFSRRSLKLANIFGSSPSELLTSILISFGFMLRINLFIVCNKKGLIATSTRKRTTCYIYRKKHQQRTDGGRGRGRQNFEKVIPTFFVTGSSSVAWKFKSWSKCWSVNAPCS